MMPVTHRGQRPAERVTRFYNGRGTAEQYIKEGKHAIKWTRVNGGVKTGHVAA